MDNERLVQNWQRAILELCATSLGRPLTSVESTFVTSRGGFLALEAIETHIKALSARPQELMAYLNSEANR
jgi:hypothetical protein